MSEARAGRDIEFEQGGARDVTRKRGGDVALVIKIFQKFKGGAIFRASNEVTIR